MPNSKPVRSEGATKARKGKPRAKAVASRRQSSPARWGTASYFAIPLFMVVYFAATLLWRTPIWVAGVYLGVSVVAFAIYWWDKSAAQAGTWRVSEDKLLLLGLCCGWPGAIVAQQVLRHKSSKLAFLAVFWITVLLNVAGFLVLCSPLRQRLLHF